MLLALAAHAPRQVSVSVARTLAVLTGLTVLLVVSGEILALRTPYPSVQRYARALLEGPWSRLFWIELVLFFLAAMVCLARLWRRTPSLAWAAITALLVCAAVLLERFLVLVAWQTHGLGLPWPAGTYHPTSIEWSVLAGLAAAGVLAFLLLARVCPAGTEAASEVGGAAPAGRQRRLLVTGACLILGLAATSVGLSLSAGLASAPFLDPILPGSPLVFLAGLFLMLSAPLAYELIPERGADTSPAHLPRE